MNAKKLNDTADFQMIQFSDYYKVEAEEVPVISDNKEKRPHTGGSSRGGAKALTNKEDILNIMRYFLNHDNGTRKSYGLRNYALVVFGFNSALRGGDILNIKLKDVIGTTGIICDEFILVEGKTKKTRVVFLNEIMKEAISQYLNSDRPDYLEKLDEPLFCSRQKDSEGFPKPITIQRYNQLMKEVKEELNLSGKISSHTCRKSWARNIYNSAPDDQKSHVLMLISDTLNHDKVATTRIYLDIQKDEKKALIMNYQIGSEL